MLLNRSLWIATIQDTKLRRRRKEEEGRQGLIYRGRQGTSSKRYQNAAGDVP